MKANKSFRPIIGTVIKPPSRDQAKPPFFDRYLNLPTEDVKPSLENNPCINLDPRDPDYLRIA
ncbi:hypothetical protein DBZ36_07895 [Alginatibacterium sediminis]|uniref:Uncharacterized protein n=1 Tax=Alginatibacterium sediminis TaxID=2164068 RepID=A0A420EI14_9ALTE|nr:hypothetical protein [Alginatibacterium sediminis]RKF20352.1 hypothetical protein DBZ36_07895 [Alginatibacterium sediminis]